MEATIVAAISAVTSLVVTIASLMIASGQRRKESHRARREEINAKYLNPLRFQTVDLHVRLAEIADVIAADTARSRSFLSITEPVELLDKRAEWFTGEGCYLTSTAYLTACFFARVERLRGDLPYLRLTGSDDTALLALLIKVQRAFLSELGIYYVLQPSIGEDMWVREETRVRTYREFCDLLNNAESLPWFERIFLYYLEAARGEKTARLHDAATATRELAAFLDRCVSGGASLAARQRNEAEIMKARTKDQDH